MVKLNFGKYSFELTHADKVYFPDKGYTKGELVEYYKNIADTMIPHIKNRAVSMLRFPNGINGKSFFQKDAPDYFPNWIELKLIERKTGGSICHVVCNNAATLAYLAGQGCITPHVWLSKIYKIDYPDRLIFDLDPPDNDFSVVKFAAKEIKKFLNDELNLPAYLMTTGSRGLHVVTPINRNNNFDFVRKLAQDTAKILAERNPKKLTTEVRKNKRNGRLFLDTARNAYAQTAVPPYSVRPKQGAPIAVPIEWDEISRGIKSQSFNIKNIFKRIDTAGDPWKDINRHSHSLKNPREVLDKLLNSEFSKSK